jgi:hypothetical protein
MELPDELLALVHDFSRPVTRPDWRTLHRVKSLDFHLAIARQVSWTCPRVLLKFVADPPGEYIFNLMFSNSPYVNHIYKRGVWIPIRV